MAGAVCAGGIVVASQPAHAATAAVSVHDGGGEFAPKRVTVAVGDSVRWSNRSVVTEHNIRSSGGDWSINADIAPVVSTEPTSTSYTFRTPGTYTYVCRFHGTSGTVVVTGSGGGTPTPTSRPTTRPAPAPTSTRSPSATPKPATSSSRPAASPKPKPSPNLAAPLRPLRGTPAAGSTTRRRGVLRGLTTDPTGRGRGLPALVALVAVAGVGAAHLRVGRDLTSSSGRHRRSPGRG